uniref:Uncharacterized protein n=1 Tax=Anguilla anguilla TaxID=7936 RepID=A0A0E9TCS8_ANGAN
MLHCMLWEIISEPHNLYHYLSVHITYGFLCTVCALLSINLPFLLQLCLCDALNKADVGSKTITSIFLSSIFSGVDLLHKSHSIFS